MAINKQTIISAFDDKLTLLQWLKTINKALDEAVLTGVEVRQKGNATFTFVVTFEDGTELESNEFVLAQGESINGATIRNGHLYLSLTNGNELDAGNVKPVTSFEINASQHLIVNYGDGTSQDLGAIFSGNVNIDGTLNATKVTGNEIVEKMANYNFYKANNDENISYNYKYAGIVKNGNKLTIVIYVELTALKNINAHSLSIQLGNFLIPDIVASKIYPSTQGTFTDVVYTSQPTLQLTTSNYDFKPATCLIRKTGQKNLSCWFYNSEIMEQNTKYNVRIEATFLLSDNMAGN